MLIRSRGKKALWLVFGLGLAACANLSAPVNESVEPDKANSTNDGALAESTVSGDSVDDGSNVEAAASPTVAPTPTPSISLPDLGPAPDISNEVWLNTDRPLNLAALRGKAVLVEFWTFG